MEFRILGPLEVTDNGRRMQLGGRKQRALLAILIVHANEIVSADKLIDELWGDTPPATAAKTLQAHVSRLRRSINSEGRSRAESGPLVTRGHGYVLSVEPGQIDAGLFRHLLEEGRRALARGEARSAVGKIEEALALWRGPALADFAYDSFAQEEAGRLEELRLNALEERIEAELALGRHAEVVAELEPLVNRNPLRERMRGQLMLALYRSDRQAEALEAYRRGRQALAEELGLEPSQALQRLERQILEHDPALAAPARVEPSKAAGPRARPRARRALLVAGIILVAVVGAAVFQATRGGSEASSRDDRAIDETGVGVLDGGTGRLLQTIPVGTAPATVTVGEGSTWVLDADDRTIARIDPNERKVLRTFSIATRPTGLAAGAGALWVGNGFPELGFASEPASVSRVDPESGVVDQTIVLPRRGPGYFPGGGFEQQFMAVSGETVWVVNPDGSVTRIDARTNRVAATVADARAVGIAARDGEVWIIEEQGVAKIDTRTNSVSRRIELAGDSPTALAVGSGSVWVADPFPGTLWRITPGPKPVVRSIPLDFGVGWVAYGKGAVWATNEIADKVYRIDPRTNQPRIVARIAAPAGVAVGEDAVWVTTAGAPSADEALPASSCTPLHYDGSGKPQFLVVSDLPLQGPREFTLPMVKAIKLILERRGFRAGRYTVGYQSCDDSTAQAGGFDIYRCFANAKAYARTPAVIGVIGAFESGCTAFQLPVANQAPEGPLAMISPSNTETGLTRPYRGMWVELEELYPSGERNYVRIAAADHLQAPGLVKAAKELGRRRVFIAWDREDDSMAEFAANMREAARTTGLQVVGARGWDPHARAFDRFARRIAAARPEAVLLAGAAPPQVDAFLSDLRAAVGHEVALIASDGFAGLVFTDAGPAAAGLYVANYGVPNEKLPAKGKRFLREFEAAGGGPNPDFSAAYGAQAAEILLDAIASSEGTRSSVVRALFRTNVEDGILGDIRFDEYGDLVDGPITIYRIVGRRAVVDRVVTASAATPE